MLLSRPRAAPLRGTAHRNRTAAVHHYSARAGRGRHDLEIAPRRRYVDRFYLVDLKRDFYRAHGHNRAILLVSQDRQELELDIRSADGWTSDTLSGPQALLTLPDFGLTCRLHEIYKNTPVGPL